MVTFSVLVKVSRCHIFTYESNQFTFKNNKIAGQVYDLSTGFEACRGSRQIGKNTKVFFSCLDLTSFFQLLSREKK